MKRGMGRYRCYSLMLLLLLATGWGCQKQSFQLPAMPVVQDVLTTIDSLQMANFFIKNRPNPDAPVIGKQVATNAENTLDAPTELEYTDETFMQLGPQLTNPYSIPNMTAAYNAFFNTQYTTVTVTHKYIRFAPANESQVALLDDSLELDLYTHPLDYEMLQDGDVYVAPGTTIEDLPYLYTVVPANYTLPAGIAYTLLADLHLPVGEAANYIEELAESMALGANYSSSTTPQNGPTLTTITRKDVTNTNGLNPTWSHLYADCYYEPDNPDPICPGITNPPPPPPPIPAVCGLPGLACIQPGYPRGRIRVKDTQLGICEPVADVKIRAKNWFRIKNTRTNALGEFFIDRKYANRVKINLLFRNDEVSVRPLRNKAGIRLSLFPITYTLGVFTSSCAMNTVEKIFERPADRISKGFEAWLACNAVNSRKEQIAFAESPSEDIKAMKDFRLNVYLQKEGMEFSEGPTGDVLLQNYLFRTRGIIDWVIEVGKLALYYFSKDIIGVTVTLLNNVLGAQKPDIVYSYNTHPDNIDRALENLSSNEVKKEFYEVYTQVGILKATNNDLKWKNYFKQKQKLVDAGSGFISGNVKMLFKALKIKLPFLPIPNGTAIDPYGSFGAAAVTLFQSIVYDFGEPAAEYYEMVEGFSTFYGHRMCDLRYGTLADPIYDQKRLLIQSAGGISSHRILLENWQPNVDVDLEKYNRIGLFYDLIDSNVDEIRPLGFASRYRFDDVNQQSIKSMFNSITGQGSTLQWYSPQLWRHFADNTKYQYPGQFTALNNLFVAYLIQEP